VQKDFAAKPFFSVAAGAYSQQFCRLLSKHLIISELNNAHITEEYFFTTIFSSRTLHDSSSLEWQFA